MTLSATIEAVLFYRAEPVTLKELGKIVDVSPEEVNEALGKLREELQDRGIVLVRKGDTVVLATHSELSSVIEQLRKEELEKSLSKAALETVTIILYKEGITKSEIDYIRGVNSQFILRNLLIRGLIERAPNPADKRSPLYRPTVDLLTYLSIASLDELPEYKDFQQELETVIAGAEEAEESLEQ